jgi:DUF218 domain-containing protein
MTRVPATSIIVFGYGLDMSGGGARLSNASRQRVNAVLDYISANLEAFSRHRGRIVFSGGWSPATIGPNRPLDSCREGMLMLKLAHDQGVNGVSLDQYVESYAELESTSTLQNALNVKEARYFGDTSFTRRQPLGIVAHRGQMRRVDYFVRKAFRLRRTQVQPIFATGTDCPPNGWSHFSAYLMTRVAFVGATDTASLRRREQSIAVLRQQISRNR